MIVLEVVVPIPLNKIFYYLPLNNVNIKNIVKKRVKVQFGKKNLIAYAISYIDININSSIKLKQIIEVIDEINLITEEAVELAKYISENYFCSIGEALSSIIPASMKFNKKKKEKEKENEKEKEKEKEKYNLNIKQNNAINLINKCIDKNIYESFLIHGVTGSGKTEIYINIIKHALKQKKSTIVLIPDISLTVQFINIIKTRFNEEIGVWHSGISNNEKYDLFLKAINGCIRIMIGARSAVFAPFKNLGLIIIDEEHECTYKQEQKPSYDARDIAKWRCKYQNTVIVLGSATPSLESYKDAIERKTNLIELNNRIYNKQLPEVKILTLENRFFRSSQFLPETIKAMSDTLYKKEQIIVFLNRRGYSQTIICKKCHNVYQCKKCSISMVFHKNPDLLKCHYCGNIKYTSLMSCQSCGCKDITVFGHGTQKIEHELKKLFLQARILRLDSDAMHSGKNYEKVYNGIKNEEYDILIGTQMIAKGFDFKKVSLVCIVDADTSLYIPDFKSAEKTFQLITQVAGRTGRGNTNGNVIVQTNHSKHYAIECSKKHDFKSFYKIEIEQRKKMFYPPFCDIAKILIKGKNKKKNNENSDRLFVFLKDLIEKHELKLKLLGPVSAYVEKLNYTYRKYIIVKGSKDNILKLNKFLNNFKKSSKIFVSIEIMPSNLI
ncbi:MAG: primosomal protein N' [Endomicrobium sp.]|jgi:primosomal protein N' (replication factor Y)|nr:primosomal protein N' [Endomicrobium sp.]